MKEILNKLFLNLKDSFLNELETKFHKKDLNGELDVFKTFLTISKSQKDFKNLIESSGINREILISEFSKVDLDFALNNKFLRYGQNLNSDKIFITTAGLYEFYTLNNLNLYEVFIAFDETKFVQDKIQLKVQEKILCIFLILFGADSKENLLDTTRLSEEELDKFFYFLKLIEKEMITNGIVVGNQINWGSGKDISFRNFLTNNVGLPYTGLYYNRPTSMYWIDLSNKKKVVFLLDLIFDNYDINQKILIYNLFVKILNKLSSLMLTEIGELPRDLNKNLLDVLRG